jgi:hypothetical protein
MCEFLDGWSWVPVLFWYLQGLLTLVIAGIALNISRQQSRTESLRLKLETYDRSLRIYNQVKELIRIVTNNGVVTVPELWTFMTETTEADFLFGAEISKYREELYRHGLELSTLEKRNQDTTLELNWFSAQYDVALAKFKPYLNLANGIR